MLEREHKCLGLLLTLRHPVVVVVVVVVVVAEFQVH